MPYTDNVLASDSLTTGPEYRVLSVGLPWFRSVPFANVALQVFEDGAEIPGAQMKIQTNGGPVAFNDFFTEERGEWFLQDRLQLRLPLAAPANSQTEITLMFDLTTPNLFQAPDQPILVPLRVSRSFQL